MTLTEIESKPQVRPRTRLVRVGLLGLGNVGQAFARCITQHATTLQNRGLRLVVSGALVRDARRCRAALIAPPPLFTNIERFLAQDYDVVVELLGGVDPAHAITCRLLERGTPVVTANKSLLAAAGEELHAVAAARGTSLRYEASVVAGVPFLGALRDRPLAARGRRIVGIINGTSNYVLTRMDRDRAAADEAVRRAIELGFAEPNPQLDLSGRDAAEKLVVLLQSLGDGAPRVEQIETTGIERLHPDDLAQARTFGGVVRPIAWAEPHVDGVAAFVGPAWLPSTHALAGIEDECNAICLSRSGARDIVFSGPGAGPDVTAATVLDDVVDVIQHPVGTSQVRSRRVAPRVFQAETGWFLRIAFPPRRSQLDAIQALLAGEGIRVRGLLGLRADAEADRVYALTGICKRAEIETALSVLQTKFNCETLALRALDQDSSN